VPSSETNTSGEQLARLDQGRLPERGRHGEQGRPRTGRIVSSQSNRGESEQTKDDDERSDGAHQALAPAAPS